MNTIELYCCGIIPLKKENDHWQVLLVKHSSGNYWAFPKGKQESGETDQQTAFRELKEETGLNIDSVLSEKELTEKYSFMRNGKRYKKLVRYFPAIVKGEIKLDNNEIEEAKWVMLSDVEKYITFSEGRNLCKETYKILANYE